jgi:hypothetical protein
VFITNSPFCVTVPLVGVGQSFVVDWRSQTHRWAVLTPSAHALSGRMPGPRPESAMSGSKLVATCGLRGEPAPRAVELALLGFVPVELGFRDADGATVLLRLGTGRLVTTRVAEDATGKDHERLAIHVEV